MEFKVKAGKFDFDKETKKVKVSKDKGLIHVKRVTPNLSRMKINRHISSGPTWTPTNPRSI